MNLRDYEAAALRTAKSDQTPSERLCNWSMGLAGESGELVDEIKKLVFHDKPVQVDALRSELGDVLWYLTVLAHELGLSLSEVAMANVEKLRERHPDGFRAHGEQGGRS